MRDCDRVQLCICGADMHRDIAADVPFVSGGEYHKAIHSDSLAISPDQRAEHERQFPNIKLDSECRPIFDNFKDHDAYLKKCGFKKERQRIRRKTKKLPTPKVTKCVAK
jgi:hypothetical protein